MMIGGWIIQIADLGDGVSELWCVDRSGDETAVRVVTEPIMPAVSDEVWWQSGCVYFDNDKRSLTKIANSYRKD